MSKPKIVTARIKDTGWPIDGKLVYLAQWSHDPDNWHLYAWSKNDDEAIMRTIWQSLTEAGLELHNSFGDFAADWKAEKACTDEVFVLSSDKVEVVEVKQEAEADPEEQAPAVTPRKTTDKGGILLLPTVEHLGDVTERHPDWRRVTCPKCGKACYKFPEADRLHKKQGVELMCTDCALESGLVQPYGGNKPKNAPHPDGNRATRRARRKHAKG